MPLHTDLIGSWEVIDRLDRDDEGREFAEPNLGSDPIALLVYDRSGYFSAQFMRREPPPADTADARPGQAANNPRAGRGYDAYFGRYVVDEASGSVTQTLLGALARENVGMVITREMQVQDDVLTIRVPTTAPDGRAVVRILRCRRVSA